MSIGLHSFEDILIGGFGVEGGSSGTDMSYFDNQQLYAFLAQLQTWYRFYVFLSPDKADITTHVRESKQ